MIPDSSHPNDSCTSEPAGRPIHTSRPKRSLGACGLSVSCTAHCRHSTEWFAEEIGAGNSGWPLTEERYSPFRPNATGRAVRGSAAGISV